jgi:hypothetical protein
MSACNLALSRSDMLERTPTSHSFTDVSENKLLLRFISYVKHSLYKNNTFWKAVVSCTHLESCYFAVSLHTFHSLSATQHHLNAQRLPTAQNDSRRSQSIGEIWANASTCPYYLTAIFSEFPLYFYVYLRLPIIIQFIV